MAEVKITDLVELNATPDDADLLEIVDVGGTPTSKKITVANLRGGLAASGANADITSLTALSGQQTIPSINLTGGQIAFPATAVPSAGSNTLDDYEEGTWTPSLNFGGANQNITYNYRGGYYTKIGNLCFFTGAFLLTEKGTSVGDAAIYGLPFTVINNAEAYSPVSLRVSAVTFANALQAFPVINTTNISLREVTEAGTETNLTDADFADNSSIFVSGFYRVA
jgi:hypothetical protein